MIFQKEKFNYAILTIWSFGERVLIETRTIEWKKQKRQLNSCKPRRNLRKIRFFKAKIVSEAMGKWFVKKEKCVERFD
jgi:hypothetical protein